MNSRRKVVLLSVVGMLVSCGLCADEKDRPLVTYLPGYLLDSSSDWKKQKADGYQTPKSCKFSRATSTNVYVNCSFPGSEFGNLYKSPQRFVNCDFTGTKVAAQGTSKFEYVNCRG